jgi:hypothetical protein
MSCFKCIYARNFVADVDAKTSDVIRTQLCRWSDHLFQRIVMTQKLVTSSELNFAVGQIICFKESYKQFKDR